MDEPLALPGRVVDLQAITPALKTSEKIAVVKTDDMEIVQFVIPAAEEIPTYEAQGELVLHCLEGHVSICALGNSHDLKAGQLLYLSTNEPFSVEGIEDSSLLATIITAKRGGSVEVIGD